MPVGLKDPVAVYNAANNVEAAVVAAMLNFEGIEAFAVEDASVVGLWYLGTLPEIHKPQVWIERSDQAKAKQILEQYEREQVERVRISNSGEPILVVCEECQEQSVYPAARLGFTEICTHCGAYVDVGEVELEGWDETEMDD